LSSPIKYDQKAERQKLFQISRPAIREAEQDDLSWVWADRRLIGLEVDREAFLMEMAEQLGPYAELYVIEDRNSRFSSGFGPVGMIAGKDLGAVYEPHATWFSWATSRNILRGMVAYLQKFRYRPIGTMVIHSLDDSRGFFRRLKKYLPLSYVGKIPEGDPRGRGDDHIFYLRCLKR